MDHDAASSDCLGLSVVNVVCTTQNVVVDDRIGALVPDLDPELVGTSTARQVAVSSGQQKSIVARSVDRARAFILALAPATTSHW